MSICCICDHAITTEPLTIRSKFRGVTIELAAHSACTEQRGSPQEREKATQRVLRAASDMTLRALSLWRVSDGKAP